ncbi:MAG: glucosyltransferase domain-containing protein, partial [Butyrivibrio sp.]|nr:glucosyltransferase domain-containing protein [Butyrivibrio sp.]
MILRSVVIRLVVGVFGLGALQDEAVQRSVTEMLGWMFAPGAKAEFAMVCKRLFVMYGVFAYAYYPIRVFLLSALVIVCFGLWRCMKQKDPWTLLLMLGSFMAAFLLAVVEGKATLYRSAQFLPLICGYGVLIAACAVTGFGVKLRSVGGRGGLRDVLVKGSRGLCVFVCAVVLWNQCADLNKWFYVDYRKYEYTKDYMLRVADELERGFDISKPVIFTGNWENPRTLVEDAYVEYSSETFYKMKRVTDLVDEHLLEKFYRDYGVWVAQTPSLSVVSWGKYAFDTDEELIRFLRLHGHELQPLLDASLYEAAEQYALELPSFPREGAIVDMGDYIIVHF